MKVFKFLLPLLAAFSFLSTSAQIAPSVKATDLPLYSGSGDGGHVLIIVAGGVKRILGADVAKDALLLKAPVINPVFQVKVTTPELKITSAGTPGVGKVFTSDADGDGTWQTPASAPWGTIAGTLSDQADLQAALNGRQPLNANLTAFAALSPTTDNFLVGNGSAWVLKTSSQAKTILGLNNVTNTDSATINTAGNTALNARIKYSDSSTMLTAYRNALNGRILYTDSSAMLTAYRNALNGRILYTDSASMLAAYRTGLNSRILYTDSSTMLAAYRTALNLRLVWGDTAVINADGNTALNARQPLDADLTTFAGITPTTVGQNLLTMANPSAIRFIKVNADNTTVLRTQAEMQSDLGITAGAGDVLGPASSTDNGIPTYDGTDGKHIQYNSTATLSDGGVITATQFVGTYSATSTTTSANFAVVSTNNIATTTNAGIIFDGTSTQIKARMWSNGGNGTLATNDAFGGMIFGNTGTITGASAGTHRSGGTVVIKGFTFVPNATTPAAMTHASALWIDNPASGGTNNWSMYVRTGNTFLGGTLEASGSIKFSNLTAGFVKSDGSGNLTVDNSTYQAADADLTTWAGITPGTGVGTFLATPSSANLISAVTDETGTGTLVFSASPTFTGTVGASGITGTGNIQVTGASSELRAGSSGATPNFTASNFDNSTTNAQSLPTGVTTLRFRIKEVGSTNLTLGAGEGLAYHLIGNQLYTEAGSSSHPLVSNLYIKSLTATDGAGATAEAATVIIENAMSGVTPTGDNSALWVRAGLTKLDGQIKAINISGVATAADSVMVPNRTTGLFEVRKLPTASVGTVTDFSAGDLSPLFTTSEATTTSTPALTFTLSNAAAHTFFGNSSGSTGPPSFTAITTADIPTLNQNTTGSAATLTTPRTVWGQSFNGSANITAAPVYTAESNPSYAAGKLAYNSDVEALNFFNNEADVTLDIGQETWTRVYNTTGSTIANGKAVYINGSHTDGTPTVALAQANAGATSLVIGVATHAIENNTYGYVTNFGVIHGLNTSGFTAGATLYLSTSSAGDFQTALPASPNIRFRVGIVGKSDATVGTIHVTPSTGDIGLGTANQVRGINSAGTGTEYKTINQTTNETEVTHAANSITIGLPDVMMEAMEQKAMDALGSSIKAQTVGVSLATIQQNVTLVDGQVNYAAVWVPYSFTCTGIKWWMGALFVGTGDQTNDIALFSYSAGTLTKIAETASSNTFYSSNVTANTLITTAWASPVALTGGQIYYVGWIYNNSAQTTAPTIGGGQALTASGVALGDYANSAKLYGIHTGQTAQPATTRLMSSLSQTTSKPYAGLY